MMRNKPFNKTSTERGKQKRVKEFIKFCLLKAVPGIFYFIQSYRCHRLFKKRYWNFQCKIKDKLYQNDPIKVLSGPFKGLRYFNETMWGNVVPRWLGSYECELHGLFDSVILKKDYARILDIGAAEGYYAVGLAWLLRTAKLYSFDIDFISRRQQRKLANINGVTNLQIGKCCSHRIINYLAIPRCLVISDIEGYEYDLLDPQLAPALKKADLLVELHNFKKFSAEDVRKILEQRFLETHNSAVISVSCRDMRSYGDICDNRLVGEELTQAVDEHRSESQTWLWLEAK